MLANTHRTLLLALLATSLRGDSSAFQPRSTGNVLSKTLGLQRDVKALFVGGDAAEEGGVGGLVSMGSELQSRLVDAFTALDESDKYDAVLTGLCAKILDDTSKTTSDIIESLNDPINLVQEMNQRRIRAGARSLMSLIDVSVPVIILNNYLLSFLFLLTISA